MPVAQLNELVTEHLKKIGYEKPKGMIFSPRGSLKNAILTGNGTEITITGPGEMSVVMGVLQYYEAISTDFYFSCEKIEGQNAAIKQLISGNSPGAWILVSVYYQAFYAAIQIARLTGKYNISFDNEHISAINENSLSEQRLDQTGTYLSRNVGLNSQGYISMILVKEGEKPHKMAWQNLDSLISKNSIEKYHSRPNVYRLNKLFKEIICSTMDQWPLPSSVRNDLNYSLINSYDLSFSKKTRELQSFFDSEDFSKAKQWGLRQRKTIDIEDHISSVGFISVMLREAVKSLREKLT
jgi:hypothetical protein